MGGFKNIEGEQFGRLLVLERVKNIGKEIAWKCECQCSEKTILTVKTRYLVHGYKKSCGCTRKEIIDLTGKKFNEWTVLEYAGKTETRNSIWLCECRCKNIKMVTDINLKNNASKSCGCLGSKRNTTHGKSRSKDKLDVKIYKAWSNMKDRCYNSNNKSYKNYGLRGIGVCDEWLDKDDGFMNFYHWSMENNAAENLSIDRINVNESYRPDNCRWTDYKTQNNNRRNNRLICFNGETKTLTAWSEEVNVSVPTIRERLKREWSLEKALLKPVKKDGEL